MDGVQGVGKRKWLQGKGAHVRRETLVHAQLKESLACRRAHA
jgi:hypothetical protein